ncbi:hypothetical protein MMC07_000242 [Pseudocyphellaria aurata]|nr:hypothetical protein [Pseudocyphellaria aurata]
MFASTLSLCYTTPIPPRQNTGRTSKTRPTESISYRITREEQQNKRVRHLTALLLRRPDLAGLVRCLTLWDTVQACEESEDSGGPECCEESEDPGESKGRVSSEAVEVDLAFKTAINALSVSKVEADIWLREIDDRGGCHPEVILAFLLPALPNVERLVLSFERYFATNYLDRIIRRAACREKPFDTRPAFEALKVFVYPRKFPGKEMSPSCFAALVKLPAIQEISTAVNYYQRVDCSVSSIISDADRTSSQLVRLELVFDPYFLETLHWILRAPKTLKTVLFTIAALDDIDFRYLPYSLSPQETSLCRLSFEYEKESEAILASQSASPTTRNNSRYMDKLPSFITFHALNTVAFFLDFAAWQNRLVTMFQPSLETTHCQCRLEHLLGIYAEIEVPTHAPFAAKNHSGGVHTTRGCHYRWVCMRLP